jgi:hypothetical protein
MFVQVQLVPVCLAVQAYPVRMALVVLMELQEQLQMHLLQSAEAAAMPVVFQV